MATNLREGPKRIYNVESIPRLCCYYSGESNSQYNLAFFYPE